MADVLSVYRRRPKCLPPALDDEKENEKERNAQPTTLESHTAEISKARKNRHQPSWIDRSLSSMRNNINKVKADPSSSRWPNERTKQVLSPNVYRKKRVEAPANFVREQKSYFEQVDAFELEEETPPSKDRWIPNLQQEDGGAPYFQFHRKGLLQAVQEDSPEDPPKNVSMRDLSSHIDPLSHILKTPQLFDSLQKSMSKRHLQISKQGFGDSTGVKTGVVHEAHGTPLTRKLDLDVLTRKQSVSKVLAPRNSLPGMVQVELVGRKPVCKGLPIIILSDDEDEFPGNSKAFSRSKDQAQTQEAAKARQSGPHVINLDDSPVQLVKCEYHRISSMTKKVSENRLEADISVKRLAAELLVKSRTSGQSDQLHCKTDERLIEEIEKLKFQAIKELPNLEALLQKCGQSVPLRLEEAIMQFSNVRDVLKLGEGTYGEAFRASNLVFKIVPMGGNFRVNGEVQKTLAEMNTEMLLTLTLNRLRRQSSTELDSQCNVCNNFIETKMVKVCQGLYGQTLIKAWEEWDIKHESENDHPKVFPENQLYLLFVLADGGKDLESFPIASFDVTRSIITQVTAALAIAEEDCEFEHRDLHWGNILVAQTELSELQYTLNGKDMQISTSGVFVHIIDFTLSRLSTGKEVLFSNLSDDPLLFKGPKGDIQAETYRKMLHLTNGRWDKRFPKTNCYWIHYLVDVLLTKKKYPCLPQESRSLRTFKKRVLSYESARACLHDDFFVLHKKASKSSE